MNKEFLSKPWLPMLVAFLLAASFIVFQPGTIWKDADEYHALAQSILQGQYNLDGQPSMLREPGYPAFRAVILSVTDNLAVIFWIQALLFVAIVWLVWDSLRRIDVRLGIIGAWATALSYGLAVYAARHLFEMFAAFLLAIVAWLAMRAMDEEKPWKWLMGLSVAMAILIMTRTSFIFLPIALIVMFVLAWSKQKQKQKVEHFEIAKRVGATIAIIVILVAPWVVRNGKTFGVWSVAGRAGIQVAARAYKADESWGRWRDSMGSVVIGRTLYTTLYPKADPIILQHWKRVWGRLDAWKLDRNAIDADRAIQNEAFSLIFSDVGHFLRAGAWTIVDLGRLLALPSPMAAQFGIEAMFWPKLEAGAMSFIDYIIVIAAHLLQFIWWIGIIFGLWYGFKRYGTRFLPAYIVIAVIVAYLPADNIVRYAAPMYPWLMFFVFWGWMTAIGWFPSSPRSHMSGRKCPYCLSDKLMSFCTGEDRLLKIAKGKKTYQRCSDCGAILQIPPPNMEDIKAFYGVEDEVYSVYKPQPVQLRDWSLLGVLSKQGKVLDVGCAAGNALRSFLASHENWQATGLDFSGAALKNAKQVLPTDTTLLEGDLLSSIKTLPSHTHDLVICEHVIEHVLDPERLLTQIARVLKEDGRVFLGYPNGGSMLMRLAKTYAYHLDAPRHIYIPSDRSIVALTQRVGLLVKGWEGQTYPSCAWRSLAYRLHVPAEPHLRSWLVRVHAILLKPFKKFVPAFFSKINVVLVKTQGDALVKTGRN